MKRLLPTLLTLILLVACICFLLPTEANAATVASGTCGDNLTWTLDDGGTLTISGTGDMYSYLQVYDNMIIIMPRPWSGRNVQHLIIEDGVTSICDYAFQYCTGLTDAIIGNSVTSIGTSAFSDCTGLVSLTLGNSVTTIGGSAFYNCTGLTGVTIPDSVTSIGSSAFYNCTGLTGVIIPDSVTSIGGYAFQYCTGLTDVTIGKGVTLIDIAAFGYCTGLITVNFNAINCTAMGTYYVPVFIGCSNLTTLNIGNYVTNIAPFAFELCEGLTSVGFSNSVTTIGQYAFAGTGLTGVTIPDSVTAIYYAAFAYCENLTELTIGKGIATMAGSVFYNCTALTTVNFNATDCTDMGTTTSPVFEGCTNLTVVNIGKNVKTIPKNAFYKHTSLTSITIPNGVITIGEGAFFYCTGLTGVTIPNSVTTISDYAFYGCTGLTDVAIGDCVATIGNRAFAKCSGLTNVAIPDSVTHIDVGAFEECSGLTYIVIPDGIEILKGYTFYQCTALSNITIPSSVTAIGNYVFFGCDNLTKVYYAGTETQWKAITRGTYNNPLHYATIYYNYRPELGDLSGNCGNNITWNFVNGTLTIAGNGYMWDYSSGPAPWYNHRSSIKEVIIPSTVALISTGAFSGCNNLETVYFSGTKPEWKACNGSKELAGVPVVFTFPYNVKIDGTPSSLEAALANAKSGQTITLLLDCQVDEVFLRMGRTLDLNGCTLTVTGEFTAANSTAQVKDSTNGEGILAAAKQHVAINNRNTSLPVWVEGEGFHFVYHTMDTRVWTLENRPTSGLKEDSVQFRFWLNGAADCFLAKAWADGAEDNDIQVKVKMSWVNAAGFACQQNFTFQDGQVMEYARKFDQNVLYVTIGGAKNVSNLQLTVVVVYDYNTVELTSTPHTAT